MKSVLPFSVSLPVSTCICLRGQIGLVCDMNNVCSHLPMSVPAKHTHTQCSVLFIEQMSVFVEPTYTRGLVSLRHHNIIRTVPPLPRLLTYSGISEVIIL